MSIWAKKYWFFYLSGHCRKNAVICWRRTGQQSGLFSSTVIRGWGEFLEPINKKLIKNNKINHLPWNIQSWLSKGYIQLNRMDQNWGPCSSTRLPLFRRIFNFAGIHLGWVVFFLMCDLSYLSFNHDFLIALKHFRGLTFVIPFNF